VRCRRAILAIMLDPDVDDERVGPLLREGVGLDRMRAARRRARSGYRATTGSWRC